MWVTPSGRVYMGLARRPQRPSGSTSDTEGNYLVCWFTVWFGLIGRLGLNERGALTKTYIQRSLKKHIPHSPNVPSH